MANIECRPVSTPAEWDSCLRIRRQVFVDEQQVPPELEQDEHDAAALHVLAWQGDLPVGTARLAGAKIGRVAVLPQARRFGIGRLLMEWLHQQACAQGLTEIYLDAQLPVLDFYARLGYRAEGEAFDDCGILHRRMRRRVG